MSDWQRILAALIVVAVGVALCWIADKMEKEYDNND